MPIFTIGTPPHSQNPSPRSSTVSLQLEDVTVPATATATATPAIRQGNPSDDCVTSILPCIVAFVLMCVYFYYCHPYEKAKFAGGH